MAKALLGASPDLVPPELLPILRGAILSHANTLVTNFMLNSKLHVESRQTAALCLLLGIPEVWVLNGSRIPTTGPLRGVKPDASSFLFPPPSSPSSSSSSDGGGGGGGGYVRGDGGGSGGVDVSGGDGGGSGGSPEGATPLLLLPQQQQHGAAAFASASGWGLGGGGGQAGGAGGAREDRDREDLLRKQAEVMSSFLVLSLASSVVATVTAVTTAAVTVLKFVSLPSPTSLVPLG